MTRQAVIRFAGEQDLDGRAPRFDYEVSYFTSGYTITTVSGSARSPSRLLLGRPGFVRLLRLEGAPELGLVAATARIDYQQATIDGRELHAASAGGGRIACDGWGG
ncbi:MAG: hypothetical protein R2724_16270 [Bryobacterales bacterium]